MDLFRGFTYPFRGFGILRKYPGLARYWVVPIFITFSALVASTWLAFAYTDDLLALLWTAPSSAGVSGVLLTIAYWVVRVLALLLGLSLLVVVCVVLSTLIAAPFNDALSEAIEVREAGRAPLPFSLARVLKDAARTVRIEGLKQLVYVSIMAPLFVVSWLVPGVGQALYVGFGALFTAAYFAADYIDWSATRRGLGIRQRLAILRSRPLLMLGFGLGVWVCLFVPLVNLAFMPMAVAGGTRLFLDLEAQGLTAV